jgi:anti-sigma regulatory factor (Ser/Thr protein kinase)
VAERIVLEVPAALSALSTVRMVLGGVGDRLEFSLEDLDDLFLATDRLLQAALETESLESLTVRIEVDGGSLRVAAGVFHSDDLRSQVAVTPGGCIDLCTLLRRLMSDVAVEDHDGGYQVVMVKRAGGGGA